MLVVAVNECIALFSSLAVNARSTSSPAALQTSPQHLQTLPTNVVEGLHYILSVFLLTRAEAKCRRTHTTSECLRPCDGPVHNNEEGGALLFDCDWPLSFSIHKTNQPSSSQQTLSQGKRASSRHPHRQDVKLPSTSTQVAMCNFRSIKDAADVAIATMHSGIQVSRVELLDDVQVHALNCANGIKLPEVPTLMFEFIGTEAYAREQTLRVQQIVENHNGSNFVFVEGHEEKEKIWRMRKEALWANLALEPDNEAMTTDVCVPLSHLAEVISRSKAEIDASPLTCPIIAHAGDGNFHTIILFDPKNDEHRKEAERLNNYMVNASLSLEGTCTGEHGVGTGKMQYLEKELGTNALVTMAKIKHALDPNNIMNPGKLIPTHLCF